MIEMTLSSRHRIQKSSPGGLRPSTLLLGHGGSPQYWLSHVDEEETFFVSFKPPRSGTEPRTLAWKAAVLTTTLGPPPDNNTNNTRATHKEIELINYCAFMDGINKSNPPKCLPTGSCVSLQWPETWSGYNIFIYVQLESKHMTIYQI